MRTWETRFQVYGSMPELPVPTVVVEEIQDTPSYRLLGRNRRLDKGSQLVYTLSGEGRFSAGAREFVLKPGTPLSSFEWVMQESNMTGKNV